MYKVNQVERKIGGRVLSIETGKIAKQADGAVMVQYGETVVLVTAVTAAPRSADPGFFPLSVDYREKQSAAGKFPGGFFKREGRPSTKEILTARMIDRPIRPLFPERYLQEVQIMAVVLSFDGENDPDILSMIGASAALSISKIPFLGPIGACRLGRVDGEIVVNPTHEQLASSDFDLRVTGRKEAMNMIEMDCKELSNEAAAEAINEAQKTVGQVCEMIDELTEKVGVEKEIILVDMDEELYEKISSEISAKLHELKQIPDKQERNQAVKGLFEEVTLKYCPQEAANEGESYDISMVNRILSRVEKEVVKKLLLDGKRPDGRGCDELRDVECEIGILPRTHGSALFTRGETQALVNITLGTVRDAQTVDGLLEEYRQSFTLHYNFPPYSVGEVRPVRGPRRREIGHGALAERALNMVCVSDEQFPYTVRVVSDITESNGSSSMASVCGGSLALMDAGVPIQRAVAGISIGMISDGKGNHKLLTDIAGEEDHFGEMDFKVAGTSKGITAIQLDIKAEGLSQEVIVEALERAGNARAEILKVMDKAISKPREQLSDYAPKLLTMQIDPEKIGKIIGPGGSIIKKMQEETESVIEVENDGSVYISCLRGNGHLEAKKIIESMTRPPEVGRIYSQSKVVSVKDFGVFVEFAPGVEGLCHISELAEGYVKNVQDVCKRGDIIAVKLLSVDDQGRYKLSRKAALAETSQAEQEPVREE